MFAEERFAALVGILWALSRVKGGFQDILRGIDFTLVYVRSHAVCHCSC